tara:strand:+ start:94465 stop:94605 length:141 start_codon:yes stop_codon:yes gene_type:complete
LRLFKHSYEVVVIFVVGESVLEGAIDRDEQVEFETATEGRPDSSRI